MLQGGLALGVSAVFDLSSAMQGDLIGHKRVQPGVRVHCMLVKGLHSSIRSWLDPRHCGGQPGLLMPANYRPWNEPALAGSGALFVWGPEAQQGAIVTSF